MTTRKKPTASLRLVEHVLSERPHQLKALVKAALEEVLQAGMTDTVGALPGQRVEGRLGYRADYYTRGLVTRIGKLGLRVTIHPDQFRCLQAHATIASLRPSTSANSAATTGRPK